MTRYAIVRFLDEKPVAWSVVRATYMSHAYASKERRTVQHSEVPTLNSFEEFVFRKLGRDPSVSFITSDIANEWTISIRKRMAESSVRTRLAVISAFWEWGISEKYFAENIFRRIEPPPAAFAGRVLSDIEVDALLATVRDDVRRPCQILLYTGLRAAELESLEWWQVRRDHLYIPGKREKSHRGRIVPIDAQLLSIIGPAPKGSLYQRVIPMQIKTVWRCVKFAAKTLGLGRVRLHDLRHTCITRFFENCDDVGLACQIFGWANANSAIPYQHMTPRRLKKFQVSYPIWEARASGSVFQS